MYPIAPSVSKKTFGEYDQKNVISPSLSLSQEKGEGVYFDIQSFKATSSSEQENVKPIGEEPLAFFSPLNDSIGADLNYDLFREGLAGKSFSWGEFTLQELYDYIEATFIELSSERPSRIVDYAPQSSRLVKHRLPEYFTPKAFQGSRDEQVAQICHFTYNAQIIFLLHWKCESPEIQANITYHNKDQHFKSKLKKIPEQILTPAANEVIRQLQVEAHQILQSENFVIANLLEENTIKTKTFALASYFLDINVEEGREILKTISKFNDERQYVAFFIEQLQIYLDVVAVLYVLEKNINLIACEQKENINPIFALVEIKKNIGSAIYFIDKYIADLSKNFEKQKISTRKMNVVFYRLFLMKQPLENMNNTLLNKMSSLEATDVLSTIPHFFIHPKKIKSQANLRNSQAKIKEMATNLPGETPSIKPLEQRDSTDNRLTEVNGLTIVSIIEKISSSEDTAGAAPQTPASQIIATSSIEKVALNVELSPPQSLDTFAESSSEHYLVAALNKSLRQTYDKLFSSSFDDYIALSKEEIIRLIEKLNGGCVDTSKNHTQVFFNGQKVATFEVRHGKDKAKTLYKLSVQLLQLGLRQVGLAPYGWVSRLEETRNFLTRFIQYAASRNSIEEGR